MRSIFERVATGAGKCGFYIRPADKDLNIPLSEIKKYLQLDQSGFLFKPTHSYRLTTFLQLNIGGNPTAKGFEAYPDKIAKRKIDPANPSSPNEEYPLSQAIIFTEYKKLFHRSGLGILIHADVTGPAEAPLPILFALGAMTDREGMSSIKRLVVPEFDDQHQIAGLEEMPITQENITLALSYAAVCAEQIYKKRDLTPHKNWLYALTLVEENKKTSLSSEPVSAPSP